MVLPLDSRSFGKGTVWARRAAVWIVVSLTLGFFNPTSVFGHGSMHDQISSLTTKIHHNPEDPALLLARAGLHLEHGNLSAALADIDQAAALAPNWARVELARGEALFGAHRFQEALGAIESFLLRSPGDLRALELQGKTLHHLGRFGDAARAFSRALEAHQEGQRPSPELFLARGQAHIAAGQLDAAVVGLDEGISRLGGLVILELPAIEAERQLGHFDAAMRRVEMLARQSRRQESWHLMRGEILVQAGRHAEAREAFLATLEALRHLSPSLRSTPATRKVADRAQELLSDDGIPQTPERKESKS